MILQSLGLEAFAAVMEAGTVHGAAQSLGMSQTAITQRILQLERELKVTLFLRSRKGMKATEEGESLWQYSLAVKDLEGNLWGRLSGERESEFQLVAPTTVLTTRIVRAVISLHKKNRNLRIHLRSVDEDSTAIAMVKKGTADLAICSPDLVPNEMDSKMLKPERFLLVSTAAWGHRDLPEILTEERAIDFYDSDQTTLNYCKKFGLEKPKKSRIFVNENDALIAFFLAGLGFGTLSEELAQPYLKSGKLVAWNRGRAMEERLALAWYPRKQKASSFQNLIEAIH